MTAHQPGHLGGARRGGGRRPAGKGAPVSTDGHTDDGPAGSTAGAGAPDRPGTGTGAAADAGQVLRRLVDLRAADADGAHLLVDVILVAAALPDQDTVLYAAEHLHRTIDALGRRPA